MSYDDLYWDTPRDAAAAVKIINDLNAARTEIEHLRAEVERLEDEIRGDEL